MRGKWILGLAVALVVAIGSTPARAVPLTPGSVVTPLPAAVVPSGTPLASITSPFSANTGTFSGILITQVFQESLANNPLGGLTFTFDLANNLSSANPLVRLTLLDYTNFLVDVSYDGAGPLPGSIAPVSANRTVNGQVIGFEWPVVQGVGGITPGTSSNLLIVRTSARYYTPTLASVIDGGVAAPPSFGPAVPEPASLAMALAGLPLLGVGYYLRRRKV